MNHQFFCIRCGVATTRMQYSATHLCFKCQCEHTEENRVAISAITKAIRQGSIPKAKELVCVDCGCAATDYDHRDYTKPLMVEPVCRGCNNKRGLALDSKLRVIPEIFKTPQIKYSREFNKKFKEFFCGSPYDFIFKFSPAKA